MEVSAPTSPSTPHPVSIGTGTKTWAEEDYASEDGLFSVTRKYRSRLRGGERISFKEPDRFGAHWQGTIPGPLTFGTSTNSEVEYLSEAGGLYAFVSTDDQANMIFTANTAMGSEHRLRLEIVAAIPQGMGRKDFIETAPASAAGVGEFRVEMPNGDYTLYRRPTAGANNVGVRTAVPVEHGKASGYKQFFDYTGSSAVPYRMRDSFGRQIGFEWDVTNDSPGRLGTSEQAIKKLALPDGSTLQYDYDDGIGRLNPLGFSSVSSGSYTVTWTSGANAYSKNRLRTVKRKSASGTLLWSRQYHYENAQFPFALTGIEDHLGRRLTTYTYDFIGDVASTESAGGADRHEFTRSYPSATRMRRTVRGPLGHVATYEFDIPATIKRYSSAKLLTVKGAANGSVAADELAYSYSGNLVASVTDRRGMVTGFTNDTAFGRPTLVKDAADNALEQQTGIVWHPKWDLPVVAQEEGLRTDNAYDAQGRLTSTTATDTTTHSVPYATAGQARTTSFAWTAQGRLAQVNGPLAPDAQGRDDITTFAYDTVGNLTNVTDAFGHVMLFAGHDAKGRAATMTDANNVVTAFGYDALGRLLSLRVQHPTTAALDAATSFDYDPEGRVTGITSPQTAKLIVDYSSIGRVTALRSEDGERIDFAYDPMGNVVSRTVKRSNGTTTQSITSRFDALGRLLGVTLGVGRPRSFAYDKDSNLTAVTDPRDFASTSAFDALGRVTQTTHPDGGTEVTGYNARNEAVSYTDPVEVTTTFVRNGFGEVIQEVSPDRGTSIYAYDTGGRLTAAIDGRGQLVDYSYDVLGRVLSKTPVGRPTSETVTYTYDSGGLGSYQLGQLTVVADSTGETRFGYDHRGNMTQRSQLVGTTLAAVLAYTHDLADRITGMTYPSGREVRYNRDAKGRVASVETRANAGTAWTTVAAAMTYQPFGAVETMSLGNGLAATNERGLDGRLKARRLTNASTSVALSDLSYVYDPDGNMTSIDDAVTPERSAIYGYDPVGRLSMTVAEGSAATASYAYTQGTNRLASITAPTGDRTIQYDARGNPTAETRPGAQTVDLAYDGQGRLTSYARSGEASLIHAYNGLDDRVATTTTTTSGGSETRRFVYAPDGRVMGEYGTSASDPKAEFIWASPEVGDAGTLGGDDGLGGYMPLAVATPDPISGGSRLLWVHGNHMGVPTVFTNASGAQMTFPTGYGLPGFPGQSRTFADLYYNRYRDYDTSTGRYIQADPIGLAGGASPYSYAMNNPLRYTDPTGEIVPLIMGCAANLWCRSAALIVGGMIVETLIQAGGNWLNGRDVLDPDCYEGGEILFAGAMGAVGGNWFNSWVKLTKGSMKWNNASRRIRRADDMVGGPDDLHHWAVPRKWFDDNGPWARVFNRSWNLKRVDRGFHQRVLNPMGWPRAVINGAPWQIKAGVGLGLVGAGVEMLDGGWE